MLGSVHTETTESNTEEISKVSSDSLSDVLRLGVDISETREPSIVQLEGVSP